MATKKKNYKESNETRLKKKISQRKRRASEAAEKKSQSAPPYWTPTQKQKFREQNYMDELRKRFNDYHELVDSMGDKVLIQQARGEVNEAKSRIRKGGTVVKQTELDKQHNDFLQLSIKRIRQILNQQQNGFLSDPYDYALRMYVEDGLIRSTIDSWVSSVVGNDIIVEPANETPEAIASAKIIDQCFKNLTGLSSALRHLLMGRWFGAGVVEIVWEKVEFEDSLGKVKSILKPVELVPIELSKFRIDLVEIEETGQKEFRYLLWDHGLYVDKKYPTGIDPLQEFKNRFIIHSPDSHVSKTRRGLWAALAFKFFMKRSIEAFTMRGIEKWAFPTPYAKIPGDVPNASDSLSINNSLQALTMGSAVTFEGSGLEIDTLSADLNGSSELINQTLQEINRDITRTILGATMSTDLFDSSGARSTAESHERREQARAKADCKDLANTLKFQLARAILEENADAFANNIPPLPNIRFDISSGPRWIAPEHYSYVTKNEAREINLGLPPLEGDVGNYFASTDSPKKVLYQDPDENEDMGTQLREETPSSESGDNVRDLEPARDSKPTPSTPNSSNT